MTLILALLMVLAAPDSSARVIQARVAEESPRIDGSIEDAWLGSDLATGFTQLTPDYAQPASEATIVFLLYDRENIYVAFRCHVRDVRARQSQMSAGADGIRLFLDSFDDNNSCYVFAVSASGVEQAYRLTDNGNRVEDWDGVWRSAVRLDTQGYSVELAVPFKTLRYPPRLTVWGVDFGRYVVSRGEKSYWSIHGANGVKVSELGSMLGIRAPRPSLHLELYPVGLWRFQYDSTRHQAPAAGLDAAWFPTPTANLQLTAFPDFAQIEADPYQVNLSKYELRLPEKRPFFVEAAENFGGRDSSLRLFYSRRIGKPLPDGQVVPILGGAKYTDRFGRFSVGTLGAVTAERTFDYYGTRIVEPLSVYSVASLRRLVLDNSEMGFTYVGKDNSEQSNHGAGFDATLRRGNLSSRVMVAGSQFGDSLDYGLTASTAYNSSRAAMYATYQQVAPEFDINGIGLTGWRGRSFEAGAGPEIYSHGPFCYAQARGFFTLSREWSYPDKVQDWQVGLSTYADFTNRLSAGAWVGPARAWFQNEMGSWQDYLGLTAGGNFSTDASRVLSTSLYGYYVTEVYNYRRKRLAPSAYGAVNIDTRLGDHVAVGLDGETVLEFKPGGVLDVRQDATLIGRPRVDFAFTPKMNLGLAGEVVRGFDIDAAQAYTSYYASLLYSWTIRPRSTFYLALNQRLDDTSGRVEPTGNIAVAKLRYLFVF